MHLLLVLGLAAATVLVLLTLVATMTFKMVAIVTHPGHGVFDAPRTGDGLARDEVRFPSRDGTVLASWFIKGRQSQTVLVLHGYTACKNDMLSHAAFLHEAGYSLLLLDLRACGDSGGSAVTLGAREREDVQAAIEYLQSRPDVDARGIGILGLSLGASLAILAACDSSAVRAVVAESAFRSIRSAVRQNFSRFTHLPSFPWAEMTTRLAEWRLKISTVRVAPEREVARLRRCALLLIHARDDDVISYRDSEAIYAIAPEPKELWLIPNAAHAMAYATLESEYAARVVTFFDRWLIPAADTSDRRD